MIKLIDNLPDNVLGISAEGEVTGNDYETIIIPILEEKLKVHQKIRMLYHLGDTFNGFEISAMWDDAKIGFKHWSSWDKIALVSDHQLINTFIKFFGHMISCELRIFKNSELEEANKWIVAD